MEDLVGDLLPSPVLRRSTKASFTEVLWGEAARKLAAEWDGTGVEDDLVDADRLRAIWSSPEPDTQTLTLLQRVWLTRARAVAPRSPAATPNLAAG
jgi:hypothetical protein